MQKQLKTPFVLSVIVLLLAVLASAGGLFIPGVYRDNEMIRTAWFGNDIVTLCLVSPLFGIALYGAAGGSLRAQLIWIGLLGFMVYNFAFYLFGTAFNTLFLVYV